MPILERRVEMLDVKDLDVYYGEVQALRSASLTVQKGEIIAVIGANGAGKSTLLDTISGLNKPRSGSILFNGSDIGGVDPSKIVSSGIIHVPEGRRIFPGLTVLENLQVATVARQRNSSEMKTDLERVLSLFPILEERSSQLGWSLSGGEQQMLAVGRGLMARPEILLLDEPSLGLAPIIIEQMFDKILQIHNEEQLTILLVEQNAFMALEISHRAYVLETGQIMLEGNSSEIKHNPLVEEAYLGG